MNKGLRGEVRLGSNYRRQWQSKSGGASERVNDTKPRSLASLAGGFPCILVFNPQ